jgi:hypothetical protein
MKFTTSYLKIFVYLLPLLGISTCVYAQDELKNIAELSLPITNKKIVMAHCMTNIIRFKDHPFEDGCNPEYYSRDNNATAVIGGLTQVNVLSDSFLKNASLDEAVAFEMIAAKKAGIDGFQFYYTLNDNGSDDIIKAYLRVADKLKIDFKFTFCISHPSGSNEAQKIDNFSQRINSIMNEAGHNNEHWLRTPDGRLIIYLWYGEQLADVPDNALLPRAYYAAKAFRRLADAVNEKFACIFSINEDINQQELNNYLDYFPATWLWTLPYKKNYTGNFVSYTCKKRKRIFTGSVFPDFYTSKILKPGTWDILSAAKAVQAGLGHIERKAIVTGLSYNFRKMMEFNIEKDVPIINVITWNDYPEGHHLAPESNHNDGFSLLLKYYKNIWQKNIPTEQKEEAIVFFKKYPADIKPSPFNIPVIYVEKGAGKPEWEDGIEVVTILSADALLILNNDTVKVNKGMSVSKFKERAGPLKISIELNNKSFISFSPPEFITNKPFRTDRLTYSYSNETEAYYKELFREYDVEKKLLTTN